MHYPIVILAWLGVMLFAYAGIRMLQPQMQFLIYLHWILLFLAPHIALQAFYRRKERDANTNPAQFDPRSTISADLKLISLDSIATSRPWWSRVISTHPQMDSVIERIAERYGINNEELIAIHNRVLSEVETPQDTYEPVYHIKNSSETASVPRPRKAGLVFKRFRVSSSASRH